MDIVLEQLMLYVDEIARLVNDAAPMVWAMLLKQVQVEIMGNAIGVVISVLLIVGATVSIKPIRKAVENQGHYSEIECWYIATGVGYVAGSAVFILCLYEMLARIINPAWYAIKLLLEAAGG